MSAPRSKEFDDVYFSHLDGLAETRYVFLEGNGLPDGFAGRDVFVVGETGFGTGLNFLAVWKMFEDVAEPEQKLHFISVEKYPLSAQEIDGALAGFAALDDLRGQLVAAYPDDVHALAGGVFEHDFGDVKVSVYFGDVVDGLNRVDCAVDAWFLDGFRPSSNPEMWTAEVFEQVGRHSREGARFATFTSAGFVRRGLEAVGFDVKKVPGFGRKREMSVGTYKNVVTPEAQ